MKIPQKRKITPKHLARSRKRIIILLMATSIIIAAIGGYILYTRQSLQSNSEKVAHQLVEALGRKDINKATSLDVTDTTNAQYYGLVAQQMGGTYALVKTQSQVNNKSVKYSYTFKSNEPKRPSTTYLRVIVIDKDGEATVSSLQTSIGEPSAWPADVSTSTK